MKMEWDEIKCKKIVLFGSSMAGKKIYYQLIVKGVCVMAFCDNNPKKWGTTIDDVGIISPFRLKEVCEDQDVLILISSVYDDEISIQLEGLGLSNRFLNYVQIQKLLGDDNKYILFKNNNVVLKKYENIKINNSNYCIFNSNDYRSKLQALRHNYNYSCIAHNRIFQKKYDLQIIVPIYNAVDFIDLCVESILVQQTKYSFLVILIDDGSSDETSDRLRQYELFHNVRVVRQSNAGVAVARNRGLREICANYIMFVDADDRLAQGSIERLLEEAYNNSYDIVEGQHYIVLQNGKIIEAPLNTRLRGTVWGKVIKAELFQNIQFPKYWGEDIIIPFLINSQGKSEKIIKDFVYFYSVRNESLSHNRNDSEKIIDIIWVMEKIFETMKRLDMGFAQKIYDLLLDNIIEQYSYGICELEMETKYYIFIAYRSIVEKYFDNFCTSFQEYEDLEDAIKKGDFVLYCQYCDLYWMLFCK